MLQTSEKDVAQMSVNHLRTIFHPQPYVNHSVNTVASVSAFLLREWLYF